MLHWLLTHRTLWGIRLILLSLLIGRMKSLVRMLLTRQEGCQNYWGPGAQATSHRWGGPIKPLCEVPVKLCTSQRWVWWGSESLGHLQHWALGECLAACPADVGMDVALWEMWRYICTCMPECQGCPRLPHGQGSLWHLRHDTRGLQLSCPGLGI